jgi:hypothetical protein
VLDFPANPASGDTYGSWIWDGEKWISTNAPAAVQASDTPPPNPKPGDLWFDTVGLALYVRYDDGTSVQWVVTINQPTLPDAKSDGNLYSRMDGAWERAPVSIVRNRIVGNPVMDVDQRNDGATVDVPAGSIWALDRWRAAAQVAGNGTVGQIALAGTSPFQYALGWTTVAAHAVVAGDNYYIYTTVEGYDIADAGWGTPQPQPVTLQFSAQSSLTGTFCGQVWNQGPTRSYVFTYDLPVADTLTKIRIAIPPDTVGPAMLTGNAGAVQVIFDLGSGSDRIAPPNAWIDGDYSTVAGAVQVNSVANATWAVTGVALMVNPPANAEPEFKSYADNLADCQRYCESPVFGCGLLSATAANQWVVGTCNFAVTKRIPPTVAWLANHALVNCPNPTPDSATVSGFRVYSTCVAAGAVAFQSTFIADADF